MLAFGRNGYPVDTGCGGVRAEIAGVQVSITCDQIQTLAEAAVGRQLHATRANLSDLHLEVGIQGVGGEDILLCQAVHGRRHEAARARQLELHARLVLPPESWNERRAALGVAELRLEGGAVARIGRET